MPDTGPAVASCVPAAHGCCLFKDLTNFLFQTAAGSCCCSIQLIKDCSLLRVIAFWTMHDSKTFCTGAGTAAIGSLHGAAAAERLSSNNRAEKRPLTDTPTEESAAAGAPNAQGAVTGSPVSSSNSHLGPNSPLSDSAYAPVMWFNGAAADSEHSEGNPAQTSQAECSSSEPRPVAAVSLEPAGTAAADSNHAVEDEGHHPSMLSTSWGDYEQQQQHGCDPLNLQQSCITNDLHMEEQQDQDQAAPNLIQSAESLSAWLGSRTASLDANDAPEALTSIAEADYISDATAVTVQHSLQHATAAAGKECEVSVSTEKHAQDSNQYAAARPSVTAECFSANCEAAKDVDQQAPSGTTSARAVKRYSQLSVSHEASRKNTEPECDIYNLESPGPILIAGQNGALVRQHPLIKLYVLLGYVCGLMPYHFMLA